jgi:hypothetical protein
MKVPSMAILDEMKQSDASIENTSGLAPGAGSRNTSKDVQHVSKIKT